MDQRARRIGDGSFDPPIRSADVCGYYTRRVVVPLDVPGGLRILGFAAREMSMDRQMRVVPLVLIALLPACRSPTAQPAPPARPPAAASVNPSSVDAT